MHKRVTLKDGRPAIIDTGAIKDSTSHILASIEGAPFQPIRKNRIAPSPKKAIGSFGELMLTAANNQ